MLAGIHGGVPVPKSSRLQLRQSAKTRPMTCPRAASKTLRLERNPYRGSTQLREESFAVQTNDSSILRRRAACLRDGTENVGGSETFEPAKSLLAGHMKPRFTIRPACGVGDLTDLAGLHEAVFRRELNVFARSGPLIDPVGSVMHFIARDQETGEAAGAMTVVDTTADAQSIAAYRLPVDASATTAFYTCLAILPEYRGLNLPVRLMFEARRVFVEPRGIRYTWLLFEEDRVSSTRLCSILKYRPLSGAVTDRGRSCRVLFREEPYYQALRESVQQFKYVLVGC